MWNIHVNKELTIEELIRQNPLDPLGIWNQKKNFEEAPHVWCLEYPFTTQDLDRILTEMGIKVDFSMFSTSSRTTKGMDMSFIPLKHLPALQYILSVYATDFL